MEKPLVLAVDQGTTNTKALLVNDKGEIVAHASYNPKITYPQSGWVEQDPLDLWETTYRAICDCVTKALGEIVAIAVTNQRETTIAWERSTGKPLGPAVVWQCRRSVSFCNNLIENGHEPFIRGRTGLTVDPMFSGSKMRWLLDNIPDGQSRAKAGEICLGTVDSWILWNLTGGKAFACDHTNASRTQLFNLHTLDWDDTILEIFGIPRASLPQVNPSSWIHGFTVSQGEIPAGIPIASLIGDSHAALFGHAGFQQGSIKATYGTGTSLMTPINRALISERGLSTTIAWSRPGSIYYALEGNIYATGAAVQWVAQLLGKGDANEIEALAKQVNSSEGVYLVPAFVGLGAPYWKADARGLICGLTRGAGPAHLARAALEAIAYQVRDVFDLMTQETIEPLSQLLADGGGCRNNLLMQFQADILNRPVVRNDSTDISAVGAAYLAGLAIGLWDSEADIQALPRRQKYFMPQMSEAQREQLYHGWREAVRRVLL
jgi:glycerol kinase